MGLFFWRSVLSVEPMTSLIMLSLASRASPSAISEILRILSSRASSLSFSWKASRATLDQFTHCCLSISFFNESGNDKVIAPIRIFSASTGHIYPLRSDRHKNTGVHPLRMDLAQQALNELFPEKHEHRSLQVRYSGRFSSYNANVRYTPTKITFSLSKAFLELSEEIRQGVIEHLLCKMYGEHKKSTKQDLYLSFMKHLSSVAKVQEQDPYLLERFEAINERYFNGMMSAPNLRWGKDARRKLGHYEYASDTILISAVFENAPQDERVRQLLDFVIYHEMLHKKHRYDHKAKRAVHHTKAFREDERKWHDPEVERKLSWFLAKKRMKRALWGW